MSYVRSPRDVCSVTYGIGTDTMYSLFGFPLLSAAYPIFMKRQARSHYATGLLLGGITPRLDFSGWIDQIDNPGKKRKRRHDCPVSLHPDANMLPVFLSTHLATAEGPFRTPHANPHSALRFSHQPRCVDGESLLVSSRSPFSFQRPAFSVAHVLLSVNNTLSRTCEDPRMSIRGSVTKTKPCRNPGIPHCNPRPETSRCVCFGEGANKPLATPAVSAVALQPVSDIRQKFERAVYQAQYASAVSLPLSYFFLCCEPTMSYQFHDDVSIAIPESSRGSLQGESLERAMLSFCFLDPPFDSLRFCSGLAAQDFLVPRRDRTLRGGCIAGIRQFGSRQCRDRQVERPPRGGWTRQNN